jgi:phosphate uptake regulator
MVNAFKSSDVEQARTIMTDYKEKLGADCEQIVRQLVTGEVTELAAGDAAALVLYVRYLKRIASHSRNLVSGLVNPFHRIGYKEKPDQPRIMANISGATMVASDSMTNFGVSADSLPQVIFSFGTAPE